MSKAHHVRVFVLFVASWFSLSSIGHLQSATPTANDLAQALQRKYDTIKDFSANFVQTYRGGVLNKEVTERGQLLIKKPGKMRWEYRSPENKLYISDGVKMYFYVPADKQVTIDSVPAEDQATTPILFLSGKGNLTRDFSASIADPPRATPPGTLALKLVPKKPQPDYEALVVAFEPETYRLCGLITTDAQNGVSTYTFSNLKENISPSDKEFEFKPPRGVDIITNTPRR
jgi:outer membrane lipoprotein carrier protein